MWVRAGTWRALVALTLVVGAGTAGVVVLGNRVEDARTQSRLLSALHIDAQRLHVAALGAALDAEVGPAEQRGIHSARTGMLEAIRGLHGWPGGDMRRLRTRNRAFSAAVEQELSAIGSDEPARLHQAALATTVEFANLERVNLRLASSAEARYDSARHERDFALLAIVALALLASGGFALRANSARRDRAALLRRENERLVELDRMKEEFVASVSHELRTPLTSIRGYLELVLEDDPRPEQAEYLRVIDRNADRLLDLINDLLDVAQAANGHLVLNREPVDLAAIVADAVAGQQPSATARRIELGLDVAEQREGRVSADRKRIGQVVDNLLSNALKFTPDGGSVDVRLMTQNGHARLEVSDTGIGIPKAERRASSSASSGPRRRVASPSRGPGSASRSARRSSRRTAARSPSRAPKGSARRSRSCCRASVGLCPRRSSSSKMTQTSASS